MNTANWYILTKFNKKTGEFYTDKICKCSICGHPSPLPMPNFLPIEPRCYHCGASMNKKLDIKFKEYDGDFMID